MIHHSGLCRRNYGGPFKMPKMSPWPAKRLSESAPFTYTGPDYLGPSYVKGNPSRKVWICLFICVAVMAVHLEVVDDMTAEQFLMAPTRFISRRGTLKEIILDNAPQFKLMKTTIDKAWQGVVIDEDVHNYTTNQNIKWRFIVEFAPWMAGFYERLVGMVTSSVKKAIGKIYLTQTQFTTSITELEGKINLQTLVYLCLK